MYHLYENNKTTSQPTGSFPAEAALPMAAAVAQTKAHSTAHDVPATRNDTLLWACSLVIAWLHASGVTVCGCISYSGEATKLTVLLRLAHRFMSFFHFASNNTFTPSIPSIPKHTASSISTYIGKHASQIHTYTYMHAYTSIRLCNVHTYTTVHERGRGARAHTHLSIYFYAHATIDITAVVGDKVSRFFS